MGIPKIMRKYCTLRVFYHRSGRGGGSLEKRFFVHPGFPQSILSEHIFGKVRGRREQKRGRKCLRRRVRSKEEEEGREGSDSPRDRGRGVTFAWVSSH